MTLDSKDAMIRRMEVYYDAGEVCDALGITPVTLLEVFRDRFDEVWERELEKEREEQEEQEAGDDDE